MSDEFLQVATAEINNEISEIQNILNSCQSSHDVSANAAKIQKSTHKIKGLAPMMGKEDLGSLSALLDSLLKKIMTGIVVDEILESLIIAADEMKKSMTCTDYNLDKIKQRISNLSSALS
ncbi:MAG: Hpt domain-containing protein [Nitrosarchaeum sp.]|nr:Hpt domain-containing protein [Nitrosarchaeum sp.]